MKKLVLYGASGHGKVILEIAKELGYEIQGFIDDNPDLQSLMGYPVLPKKDFDLRQSDLFISIGQNKTREKVFQANAEYPFATLISKRANLTESVKVGTGTVVMNGVSINAETIIGSHCIINTNASIDHDCVLGDFVHISPNAALAGDVHVGKGTQIGIGACVIQGIRIGKNCLIGAGAVIIRDIPDHSVVVGNPGKIIKNQAE